MIDWLILLQYVVADIRKQCIINFFVTVSKADYLYCCRVRKRGNPNAWFRCLFSGKPGRVKANIDAEEAEKYRRVFLKAGGLVSIVPAGSNPSAPEQSHEPTSRPEPAPDGLQLSPANTGSLIDTAKPTTTFDSSSADNLSLLPADTLPPDARAKVSFDLENTGHFEVLPANAGSLEDCSEKKAAVQIPDISSIKLVE